MQKSTFAVYSTAILLIMGAGFELALRSTSVAKIVSTTVPTANLTTTPSPSPYAQMYADAGIGISLRYPEGYYTTDKPATKEVDISNYKNLPVGMAPAGYQMVGLSYDSTASTYESVVSGLKGAVLTNVPVIGGTVRLYTYQNPSHSDRTLAMAFFSGKYPYTINMGWDAYNSTQDEADREAAEVALIKQVVPTIVIMK